MLVDSYPVEDVFARMPEVAAQTDPVLKTLDGVKCARLSSGAMEAVISIMVLCCRKFSPIMLAVARIV